MYPKNVAVYYVVGQLTTVQNYVAQYSKQTEFGHTQ